MSVRYCVRLGHCVETSLRNVSLGLGCLGQKLLEHFLVRLDQGDQGVVGPAPHLPDGLILRP